MYVGFVLYIECVRLLLFLINIRPLIILILILFILISLISNANANDLFCAMFCAIIAYFARNYILTIFVNFIHKPILTKYRYIRAKFKKKSFQNAFKSN